MMIIVTGATGHIGNVLVKRLLQEGNDVGVIVHQQLPAEIFGDLPIKIFKADVTDYNSLLEPFSNAEMVYHLAAKISISSGEFAQLKAINVGGVQNIVQACMSQGVKKLVYASSVHALVEAPHGTAITETVPQTPTDVFGDYAKSKVLAYHEIMKGFQAGLNVVIGFPSGVIGPYDYKPSQIGQIIRNFLTGKNISYIDGEYDYVDVRDVVNGLMLIAQKGKAGEGYTLSGNKMTVRQIYDVLRAYTQINSQLTKIPSWLAYSISFFSEALAKFKHEDPLLTPYSVAVLKSNALISNLKAKTELGYTTRPIEKTFQDAVDWFRGKTVPLA